MKEEGGPIGLMSTHFCAHICYICIVSSIVLNALNVEK